MTRFPDVPDSLTSVCIHCGLCLENCPTYAETGREAESPRGRILLMEGLARGRWEPGEETLGPLDRCLGCLACEAVCPSGVPYGRLLETARAAGAAVRPRSRVERFLVRHLLWRGGLLEAGAKVARALGANQWRRLAHKVTPRGARTRLWPVLEPHRARPAATGEGPPAVLFRGCAARAVFPETEAALLHLLQAAGYRVSVVSDPECCGAMAAHAGEEALARRLSRGLLDGLEQTQGPIVLTASGCAHHATRLSHWVGSDQRAAARRVEARVLDAAKALEEAPRMLQFVPRDEPRRVVYQDPCHQQHGMGIGPEPRAWLRRAGAEVLEPEERELCCGSAGSYNLAHPPMAEALGRRKAARLAETGADMIVTSNPGCAVQLRAYASPDLPVVTWARFLEQRLKDEGTTWL